MIAIIELPSSSKKSPLNRYRLPLVASSAALYKGGVVAAALSGITSMTAFSTLLVAVAAWYFGLWVGLATVAFSHVVSALALSLVWESHPSSFNTPFVLLFPIMVCEILVVVLVVQLRQAAERHLSMQRSYQESLDRLEMGMHLSGGFGFTWEPQTDRVQRSGKFPDVFDASTDWRVGTGSDYFQAVHPDDRKYFLEQLHRLSVDNPKVHVTYRVKCCDGRYVCLEESAVGEFDAQGKLCRLRGMSIDITGRKQMEDDSKRNSELLAKTVDALEEAQATGKFGNWSYDFATGSIHWSRQLFCLYGLENRTHAPDYAELMELYEEEDAKKLDAIVQSTANTGQPYSIVLRKKNPTNGIRYIRAEGRAKLDAEGNCVGLVGTCIDVTQDIELQEALRLAQQQSDAANRSKSEFLANMSHEIRTPLTAILGYADVLLEDADHISVEERRDYLATIKRNGDHLLAIINDILDLSRIEANKLTMENLCVSPIGLLREVRSLMQIKAVAKKLTLKTRVLNSVPQSIRTDPTRLRQILVNLIGNAIKFTESGSVRIDLSFSKSPIPQVIFEITDTGIGMTEEQLSRIFGAFEQGDSTTARKYGGSGLGLRISRRLAEILGGTISVKSEVGRGSCFTLALATGDVADVPMDNAVPVDWEECGESHFDADASTPAELVGLRILLAEDGFDNQKLNAFHLRRAGADVQVVSTGEALRESVTQGQSESAALKNPFPFDLILTDNQMPGLEGYTVANLLRAKGCRVPIITLTAQALNDEEHNARTAGCNCCLPKSVGREQLIQVCARSMNLTHSSVSSVPSPKSSFAKPRDAGASTSSLHLP